MIKSVTFNVAKSKKKVAESKEKSGFLRIHFAIILNLLASTVQRLAVGKLIIACVAVGAAISLVEILIRVTEEKKHDFSACQSLDRNFHHVMIADSLCRFKTDEWDVTYKMNNSGLRDEKVDSEKGEKFRILLLGDSFAQGHGVEAEESFGEILEEMLNLGNSEKYEVINAGVFGYSPIIEYLYLKKKGLEFKPDLVILAFSLTDFWEDRQRFSELRLSYPEKNDREIKEKIAVGDVEFDWEKINRGGSVSAADVSWFEETIFKFKHFLRENFRTYQKFAEFWDSRNEFVQQDVIYQGDIDRDIAALVRGDKISEQDYQELWKLPVEHLALVKKLLDELVIPLIVVGIPDAFQVSSREWPGRSGLAIAVDFSDPRGPYQAELSRRLTNLDISFVDLISDFKNSGIYPLYFSRDGHFRQRGHVLAAGAVFRELKNRFPNLH